MLYRLFKVFYVVILLFGLLFTFFVYSINAPNSYTSYSYKVMCNNGKVFDPTSKPIMTRGEEPYDFLVHQVNSECEYGHAGEPDLLNNENVREFTIEKTPHIHIVTTKIDQIKNTLITLIVYNTALEIIRRTILYIILGRPFIPKKVKRHKNETK